MTKGRYVNARAAAQHLGMSVRAIYRLVNAGKIPHHRPAGRIVFDLAEIDRWVERAPSVSVAAAIKAA